MPRLVLDEPTVNTAEDSDNALEQVVTGNIPTEQQGRRPRLVLDTPEQADEDIGKIVHDYLLNSPATENITKLFDYGDGVVENLSGKVENLKTPFVSDVSTMRYFPAYFTADLMRQYKPTNIALSYLGGKALGIVGKSAWKYVPENLKQGIGRMLVYRFGQPQDYAKLAENRILNITKGFEQASETGKALTTGMNRAEQLRLGQIMRGGITTNPKLEAVATPARELVDGLSKELIKQGVATDKVAEVIENNLGTYLPRLYRQKEVEKSLGVLFAGKKPVRIDLSRLKRRKDLPLSVRKQLGEIEEAGYPTAKAIGQMTQMTETAKLFNSVAANTEWTSDVALDGFVKMGDAKTLGKLSGKWVKREIADDINDIISIDGVWFKRYKRALGYWKAGKTILNPSTHARNMMSNTILLDLSGVNHVQQARLLPVALRDLATKGQYYQEAKNIGLMGNEYYAAELQSLIDSFPHDSRNVIDFVRGVAKGAFNKAGGIYQAEEQWFKLAKFISERQRGVSIEKAAGEAEKWLFNYSKTTPFIKKVGQTVAPFVTFTYKALPRIAEVATNNPLKIYKYIAMYRAINSASAKSLGMDDKDIKEANSLMPEYLKGLGKYTVMLPTKDDKGNLMYMDLSYILPIGMVGNLTDSRGIWAFMSNPILQAYSDMSQNKQSFTGKPIYEDTDTVEEKMFKRTDYLYKALMPSLAPAIPKVTKGGYSWQKLSAAVEGRPDYYGRERSIPLSTLDVLGGIKVTPVDRKLQKMFKIKDTQRKIDDLTRQMYSIAGNKSLTKEERQAEVEKIKKKMKKVVGNAKK